MRTPDGAEPKDAISVRGARVHNLKNVSFQIRHNSITVVTGVSGSGKSSLAFDTIYAEGQRRYIESLSAYARQFLERIEKPDVDEITGIAPAISIRQRNSTRNPRSTVATATEIYDYLRLLYARVGTTYCMKCGGEVRRDTMDEIAARVASLPAGARFYVLYRLQFPVTPGKRGAAAKKPAPDAIKQALTELQKRGFNRLYQNDRIFEFSSPEALLDVEFAQPVYVLVDRLAVSPDSHSRLIDSVEICYREGGGETIMEFPAAKPDGSAERIIFNERFECKKCGIAYQEPEPRLFSFNNPAGACPRCQGFGNTIDFDIGKVIPDHSKSLEDGAIEPWTKPKYRGLAQEMMKYASLKSIPTDVPFRTTQCRRSDSNYRRRRRSGVFRREGIFRLARAQKIQTAHSRFSQQISRICAHAPNATARGCVPKPELCWCSGKTITEVCAMSITGAREFFASLKLAPAQETIAGKILEEVAQRLRFLDESGLEYLTLDRLTSTLSGGEAQRIQLASSLGSQLVGALYVLDEPSIGLHPRDTHRLIKILESLRDLGNTILVVEHDPDTISRRRLHTRSRPGRGRTRRPNSFRRTAR